MSTLFDLRADYEDLLEQVNDYIDENGEITEGYKNRLDEIKDTIQGKAIAVACFVKTVQNEIVTYKTEIDRLVAYKRRLERKVDYFKNYLTEHCLAVGIDKINDTKADISFRASERIEIADQYEIPEQYQKITYTPDKVALKDAIKSGQTFPGVLLVKSKNIQIR